MSKRNKVSLVRGYHISHDNGRIRGNQGISIQPGVTYQATGRLRMCEVGCHASVTLEEAHSFRHLHAGRTVSFVEVTGDVRIGNRKVVGRRRKVLATYQIENEPETETKRVFVPGSIDGELTATVIPESFFKMVEKKLHASYARNKKKIDASDTVVVLKR